MEDIEDLVYEACEQVGAYYKDIASDLEENNTVYFIQVFRKGENGHIYSGSWQHDKLTDKIAKGIRETDIKDLTRI